MARVALCQEANVEYMGYMCISAVLKQAGHTVEVFVNTHLNEDRLARELAEFKPDVTGFSILTPTVPWALRTAETVKQRLNTITVFGNIHAIFNPEIIENPGVDIVCIGEGEFCMLELCEAVDKKADYSHIHGFWVKTPTGIQKNPLRTDLVKMEEMPFQDRQLYNKYAFFRHSHYMRVHISRGCPYNCSFCYNPQLRDHYGNDYLRRYSPEKAIEAIEYLISNHTAKVKHVFFVDEVLWSSNKWLEEFLALYKQRIHLPFCGAFRFGPLEERHIQLLAEAGAWAMYIATESGDEKQRMTLLGKRVTDEHIFQIAGWMKKYGISYGSSAMFGLPGDTFEDHVRRLDFYKRLRPFHLYTSFFQPYPNIALTQREEVQKYMPKDKDFDPTVHHQMYLELPGRDRMTNLKKIYSLCLKFPRLQPLLIWLTRFRLPMIFDLLFLFDFTHYVFKVERISILQFLVHVKTFAVNPLLRKRRRPIGLVHSPSPSGVEKP